MNTFHVQGLKEILNVSRHTRTNEYQITSLSYSFNLDVVTQCNRHKEKNGELDFLLKILPHATKKPKLKKKAYTLANVVGPMQSGLGSLSQ